MEDAEWRLPYGVLPSSLVSDMGIGIAGFHITTLPGQALKMTYKRKDRKIPSCKHTMV